MTEHEKRLWESQRGTPGVLRAMEIQGMDVQQNQLHQAHIQAYVQGLAAQQAQGITTGTNGINWGYTATVDSNTLVYNMYILDYKDRHLNDIDLPRLCEAVFLLNLDKKYNKLHIESSDGTHTYTWDQLRANTFNASLQEIIND